MLLALQARNMTVGEANQLVERKRQELAEAEAILESRQQELAAAVVSPAPAPQVVQCPSAVSGGLQAAGDVRRCRLVNCCLADTITFPPAALSYCTLQ